MVVKYSGTVVKATVPKLYYTHYGRTDLGQVAVNMTVCLPAASAGNASTMILSCGARYKLVSRLVERRTDSAVAFLVTWRYWTHSTYSLLSTY